MPGSFPQGIISEGVAEGLLVSGWMLLKQRFPNTVLQVFKYKRLSQKEAAFFYFQKARCFIHTFAV